MLTFLSGPFFTLSKDSTYSQNYRSSGIHSSVVLWFHEYAATFIRVIVDISKYRVGLGFMDQGTIEPCKKDYFNCIFFEKVPYCEYGYESSRIWFQCV